MSIRDYWESSGVVEPYRFGESKRQRMADVLCTVSPELTVNSLLEIGPVGGLAHLVYEQASTVVHLDVSMPLLKRSDPRLAGRCLGSVEVSPFRARSLDLVFMKSVLWTLRSPERALSEALRVLGPAGRLFVVERTDSSDKTQTQAVRRQEERVGKDGSALLPPDLPLRVASAERFVKTIARSGFEVEAEKALEVGDERFVAIIGKPKGKDWP